MGHAGKGTGKGHVLSNRDFITRRLTEELNWTASNLLFR
jgi:hypothetical protein